MHSSIRSARNSPRCWLALFALAALFAATAPAQAQTVYTVGNTISDPDCDYIALRQALQAASTQVGGSVIIKVAWDTDISLGYSWPSTDSAFKLTNPQADISILGGYASCGAPGRTTYTHLTYTSNADADADHTMLAISNATSNPRRTLTLSFIRLEGASNASMGGPTFGGGLEVTGNAEVVLRDYSRVSGFHATAGGGVALLGSGTDPALYPQIDILQQSEISNNTANNGGGIYSLFGRVKMQGGLVLDNSAQINGGGINIVDHEDAGDANSDNHFALLVDGSNGYSAIARNKAGTGTYSATSGLGGGVYSLNGQIYTKAPAGGSAFWTAIASNEANVGGGIYVRGPNQASGGPYTVMTLNNTIFNFNTARGKGGALYMKDAVAGLIDSFTGFHPCKAGVITEQPSPCSFFGRNLAEGSDGEGDIPRGGAIYLTNTRSDGMSRPALRVYRTRFDGNRDPNGLAAVAVTDAASELLVNRSIFTNNDAKSSDGAQSALIYSHTGKNLNFRYNTVLDSNTSTRMFNMGGGILDVTGSILWGTVDRTHPFHFVWFDSDGADMLHYGCLLVRDSDGGTAGIPGASTLWSGHAPNLDQRFAPRGNSAAIDHCDTEGGIPPLDAYGRGLYDVAGVAPRYGNHDLGAVEQTDVIFANSFGTRPDN